jgi:hypothetical protein
MTQNSSHGSSTGPHCPYLTWVGAYILNALDPPDHAIFIVHIATCQRCRDEIVALAELPALLARAMTPPGCTRTN